MLDIRQVKPAPLLKKHKFILSHSHTLNQSQLLKQVFAIGVNFQKFEARDLLLKILLKWRFVVFLFLQHFLTQFNLKIYTRQEEFL